MSVRRGIARRETRETYVEVEIVLEPGDIDVSTPIPFLNHILETILYYSGFSGRILAREKLRVDDHHVVEDVAVCLGQAISEALGDRRGISRFGWAVVPMDDSLAIASVDLGGRPYAVFKCKLRRSEIGGLALENVRHLVHTLAYSIRATIHVWTPWGHNSHHKVEAMFKALGLALRQACSQRGSSEYFSTLSIKP